MSHDKQGPYSTSLIPYGTTKILFKYRLLRALFYGRILNFEMSQAICAKCGAVLLSGTSFCRQCGQPAVESTSGSEQVTALFGQAQDGATTKRLDPRPTTPGYEVNSQSLAAPSASLPRSKLSWPKLITIGIGLLLVIVVSVGVVWSLRAGSRSAGNIQVSRSLIYPGSRTVTDIGDRGGAVLQLETTDALDKVQAWYESNINPTKTLRVNSTSIILKRDRLTVTLVSEDKLTSIVIKQAS
jgi:hypothetical protein